ncbi:MAG: hypothetical protein PHX25_00385 [Candidatus Pacebacteria bacterium]|nr:hypothetical protein [Candidatus Paceibacterota bacterium]
MKIKEYIKDVCFEDTSASVRAGDSMPVVMLAICADMFTLGKLAGFLLLMVGLTPLWIFCLVMYPVCKFTEKWFVGGRESYRGGGRR